MAYQGSGGISFTAAGADALKLIGTLLLGTVGRVCYKPCCSFGDVQDFIMNTPTSARDRFLAFAFCLADMLVELDTSKRVLFAVGATKSLLGVGPEGVSGKNFMDMVSPKDRVLVD